MPEVSVIIPTFNRSFLIERSVQSVLNQTFTDFEIIVVDDGSTDNTETTINKLSDKRIVYLKHKTNKGSQSARNTGVSHARGNFIAFLDSDDGWVPNKLELQLELFKNSPASTGVVYSNYTDINECNYTKLDILINAPDNIYKELLTKPGIIDFVTPLIRKECFETIGMLDETIPSYHEWDTFIRIAEKYEFRHLPKKTGYRYIHQYAAISKDLLKAADAYLYLVEKHQQQIVSICGKNILARHYSIICWLYCTAGCYKKGLPYYLKGLKYLPLLPIWSLYEVIIHVTKKIKARNAQQTFSNSLPN